MAGRKPMPTQMKLLKGTFQKCRQRKEPKPPKSIPNPPSCLDSVGKREWRRITPELDRLGLISNLDMAALAGYCQAFSTWFKASKELKNVGKFTIVTDKGNVIQHPLVGVINTAAAEMRRFLVEFGMTPSSRSKVNCGESEKDSEYAKLPGGAKAAG